MDTGVEKKVDVQQTNKAKGKKKKDVNKNPEKSTGGETIEERYKNYLPFWLVVSFSFAYRNLHMLLKPQLHFNSIQCTHRAMETDDNDGKPPLRRSLRHVKEEPQTDVEVKETMEWQLTSTPARGSAARFV